jgi:hypothetical protein
VGARCSRKHAERLRRAQEQAQSNALRVVAEEAVTEVSIGATRGAIDPEQAPRRAPCLDTRSWPD